MQHVKWFLSVFLATTVATGCSKKKSEERGGKELSGTHTPSSVEDPAAPAETSERTVLAGTWQSVTVLEGEGLEPQAIPFGLTIAATDAKPSVVVSGDFEMPISSVTVEGGKVKMEFAEFHTSIVADFDAKNGTLHGTWILPWVDGTLDFAFEAKRAAKDAPNVVADSSPPLDEARVAAVPTVNGMWEVSFSEADGTTKLCGARFEQEGTVVRGSVVAPTGDYGHLAGTFQDGKLRLYSFNGAFAYSIAGDAQADGTLAGTGQINLFQQTFTAQHVKDGNLDSDLPRCAEVTKWSGKESPLSLKFTDVAGNTVALADAGLAGKVVLIDFFGTWCPNCHELIPLLKRWHEKYQAKGLEIIGVGFEFDDGQEAVAKYRDKYKIPYRMLVGVAPQDAASIVPQLPLASYPTLLLVGRDGKPYEIQTGFPGLAAGDFREADAARFEAKIEKLLMTVAK